MIGLSNKFNYKLNKINKKIDVSIENKYYGSIGLNMYNLLLLMHKKDKETLIYKIQEKLNCDLGRAAEIYNQICNAYNFILEEDENKMLAEPVYYGKGSDRLNLNRIRHFIPKSLVLSISRECFMKCEYCYAGAIHTNKNNSSNNLSLKNIEKIVQEAKELKIHYIELTGGDPFIRKDLFEILDVFEKNEIRTSFSTKAALSDEHINKLSKYKCIDYIQISIDSLYDDEEKILLKTNDYSRNRLETIEKLVKTGIVVKTNSVITSVNIDKIFDLFEVLDELGVKEMTISPYMNNLFNEKTYLFPQIEKYEELSQKLLSYQNSKIKYPIFLKEFNKEKVIKSIESSCGACLDGFVIAPNGNASICERMSYHNEFSLGNIENESIIEIWNKENEISKYYMPDINLFKGTKCYECSKFNYCINARGLCYVHSKIINSKIYSPDSQCTEVKFSRRII